VKKRTENEEQLGRKLMARYLNRLMMTHSRYDVHVCTHTVPRSVVTIVCTERKCWALYT